MAFAYDFFTLGNIRSKFPVPDDLALNLTTNTHFYLLTTDEHAQLLPATLQSQGVKSTFDLNWNQEFLMKIRSDTRGESFSQILGYYNGWYLRDFRDQPPK